MKEPLPELKEATPEQIQKSKEHNTLANRLYQRNFTREASNRSKFKEEFDKNLDMIWRTGDVSFLEEDNKKHTNISPNPNEREQTREKSPLPKEKIQGKELTREQVSARLFETLNTYNSRIDQLPHISPERKEKLKADIKAFLLQSIQSTLYERVKVNGQDVNVIGEYNASSVDTDREP